MGKMTGDGNRGLGVGVRRSLPNAGQQQHPIVGFYWKQPQRFQRRTLTEQGCEHLFIGIHVFSLEP